MAASFNLHDEFFLQLITIKGKVKIHILTQYVCVKKYYNGRP